MVNHALKPSEVIAQIGDLLASNGCQNSCISFQTVGVAVTGERQIYGFWISAKPVRDVAEMREIIELFHSSGFKPLSITRRQSDIVIFALSVRYYLS